MVLSSLGREKLVMQLKYDLSKHTGSEKATNAKPEGTHSSYIMGVGKRVA